MTERTGGAEHEKQPVALGQLAHERALAPLLLIPMHRQRHSLHRMLQRIVQLRMQDQRLLPGPRKGLRARVQPVLQADVTRHLLRTRILQRLLQQPLQLLLRLLHRTRRKMLFLLLFLLRLLIPEPAAERLCKKRPRIGGSRPHAEHAHAHRKQKHAPHRTSPPFAAPPW